MRTLTISLSAACAALYAIIGYLTYLGIFAPVFGIVRFWPSVVVPAVFSYLFGPTVGGMGAAIGIFISDMLIHGNALLSLTVGVPANFICFYLIGVLSRRRVKRISFFLIVSLIFLVVLLITTCSHYVGILHPEVFIVFLVTCILSYVITIVASMRSEKWLMYYIACTVGLAIGSTIIGLGVWGFSQFFLLPEAIGGGYNLPFYASLILFIWTFLTEIPFLLFLGPPILSIAEKAVPRVKVS